MSLSATSEWSSSLRVVTNGQSKRILPEDALSIRIVHARNIKYCIDELLCVLYDFEGQILVSIN